MEERRPTAVVCDDDRLTRQVVTGLLEERGVSVLAEADCAPDAVELLDRFGPDILVLDLSLAVGSGADVVDHVRDSGARCSIVVFSAFASAVPTSAVTRVVGKPDFEALERALSDVVAAVADEATPVADRRAGDRAVGAPRLRTDGVDDAVDFYELLAEANDNDAVVAVPLVGDDVLAALRAAIRHQDRLIRRQDMAVVLLVSGGQAGPAAVLARLARTHPDAAAEAGVARLAEHGDGEAALRHAAAATATRA